MAAHPHPPAGDGGSRVDGLEAGCGGAGAAVSDPHCASRGVSPRSLSSLASGAPQVCQAGKCRQLLCSLAGLAGFCFSNQSPVSNEHVGPLFKSQKKVLFKVLEYETFSLFPGEGRWETGSRDR